MEGSRRASRAGNPAVTGRDRAQVPREIRIEDLLGRRVVDRAGRKLGRVSEIRAEPRGSGLEITGFVIGAWGWIERLAMQNVGRGPRGWFARWDQLDFTNLARLRLTCTRSELELEPPRVARTGTGRRGEPRLRVLGRRRRRPVAGGEGGEAPNAAAREPREPRPREPA